MYTFCSFTETDYESPETLESPSGDCIQTWRPDSVLGIEKRMFFATWSQQPSYLMDMDNGHSCLGFATDRRVEVTTYANLVQIKNMWNLTSTILIFVRWCLDMLTDEMQAGVVETHISILVCGTPNDGDSG